jgi:hypothetical protein
MSQTPPEALKQRTAQHHKAGSEMNQPDNLMDFSTDPQDASGYSQRSVMKPIRPYSPDDMSLTSAKSPYLDASDDDSKSAAKSLNQSQIVTSRRRSAKAQCVQCSAALSKSGDRHKCKYCRRVLCARHCSAAWKTLPCCESCHRTLSTNEQRGKLEAGDQIERAKVRLSELEREHQSRLKHSKDLESQAAKVREALRQKLLDHKHEFERMQERLDRGQERNEKVLSQIGHLNLVLDDARKSEASTQERAAETEEEVESLHIKVKLAEQNREVLTEKLELLNEQQRYQLEIKKFMELGCKPCKKRFINAFRSDLVQNDFNIGAVSFISAGSVTPKASFKVTERRDQCRCFLM